MIGWAVFVALALLSTYVMVGLSCAIWRQYTGADHDGREAAKRRHPAYRGGEVPRRRPDDDSVLVRIVTADDWDTFIKDHRELR